jgi:hypothetical protein
VQPMWVVPSMFSGRLWRMRTFVYSFFIHLLLCPCWSKWATSPVRVCKGYSEISIGKIMLCLRDSGDVIWVRYYFALSFLPVGSQFMVILFILCLEIWTDFWNS